MNAFFASKSLLQSFADANACNLIPSSRSCKLFKFHGKKIIIVASSSTGSEGVLYVKAYECKPIEDYEGEVYTHDEHVLAVLTGKKERGYAGVVINADARKWVITENEFAISPIEEFKQMTLL